MLFRSSFLAAGWKFKESSFQMTAAQTSSSLMVLACSTLVIPAAYHASRLERPEDQLLTVLDKVTDLKGLLTISRGTALVSRLLARTDAGSKLIFSVFRSSCSATRRVRVKGLQLAN